MEIAKFRVTRGTDFRGRLARMFSGTTQLSGINRLVGQRYGGLGTVFMLHSVVEDPRIHLFDSNHLSVSFLEKFVGWARRKGLDFLSLDEVLARLDSGIDHARPHFVALTFDDGYADNLVNALPVLERYEVPFTVYIATQMVTREADYWWRGLQNLFTDYDEVEIEVIGKTFACGSLEEKVAAYRETKRWVREDITARSPLLRETFQRYRISLNDLLDCDALSEAQVRELGAHPLVSIGGHTTSHPELAKLAEAEARQEISENRIYLENVAGVPVDHFAYPFGGSEACGTREERMVSESGFRSATTTRVGNIFTAHRDRPFALPRVHFSGNREYISFAAMQMGGMRRLIESRMGEPVVTM